MRKIFACILMLVSVCYCGITSASYIDDLAAANPKLIYDKGMAQNKYGAEGIKKSLKVFCSEDIVTDSGRAERLLMYLRLLDWLGNKKVFADVYVYHNQRRYFDTIAIGNGVDRIGYHSRPITKYHNDMNFTYLMFGPFTKEQLIFMRNTKIVNIEGPEGHATINIKNPREYSLPYFEAIESAIKFLDEQ